MGYNAVRHLESIAERGEASARLYTLYLKLVVRKLLTTENPSKEESGSVLGDRSSSIRNLNRPALKVI